MARKAQRGDRAARYAKVRELATIVRDAEPTPFAMQAACTHALRAELCLRGWPYAVAHAEADKLVKAALDLVGAKRPSWEQAQPDWCQEGVRTRERTTCARCARPLPEGHFTWCSTLCRRAGTEAKYRAQRGQEVRAAERAREAAWSARQPARTCEECGGKFQPHNPSNHGRFCGVTCRNRANARKNKGFGSLKKMGI